MSLNRDIYNTLYATKPLDVSAKKGYDLEMVRIRQQYNNRFGTGKDVLDLCCGSGAYLLPILPKVKSAIGLDFSRNLLRSFQKNLNDSSMGKLSLVEGDAQHMPIPDNIIDYVFSYCSLYYLPRLDLAFSEISRVLRPGGYAALECGNLSSLNHLVNMAFHQSEAWAKPFFSPYSKLHSWLKQAGLVIVEYRAFQLLPMYGTPKGLLPLMPLLSPKWKTVLGLKIRGRMLDEWISKSWPLRRLAFRQFFLVRKA